MTPERVQTICQLAIVIGVVLTGLGGYGAHYFGEKIAQQKEAKASNNEKLLRGDVSRLVEGNEKLQAQIAPFVDLAKQLHPGLASDEALKHLREELNQVKRRAQELEDRAAPRTMSAERRAEVVRMLAAAPPLRVTVGSTMENEAFYFANELGAIVQEAGWTVEGRIGRGAYDGPIEGVSITFYDEPPPPGVLLLIQGLRNAGFQAMGHQNPRPRNAVIQIVVGEKRR